ncbi:MAG: hypothetical protein E6G85_13395 [Alphaproteobacteria bacterium]|nr:MAG: hypothetical protein E6G85_13395 [Alphaproteobacteria bacterium]
MEDEKSALLEQADRCRSQAQAIGVHDAAARLTAMAQNYKEEAAKLAAASGPLVGSRLQRQLIKLTRQAPVHSIVIAFLVGFIVARRR